MRRERRRVARWAIRVVRVVLAVIAVGAFWMAQSGVALADNCSGVSDCLNSDSAAIWIGMAAFMLMLLDVGWHLIPGTGLLDSFLGYNVITWEPMSGADRLLGVGLSVFDIPGFPGGNEVGYVLNADTVSSGAEEDKYHRLAFERMVMFGILTPDGQIIHHGSDDSVFPPPGGGGDNLQISGGTTYGGTGTLDIHLGTMQGDTITLNTDGPLHSGDSVRIEIRTDGTGPTGGV